MMTRGDKLGFLIVGLAASALLGAIVTKARGPEVLAAVWIIPDPEKPESLPGYGEPVLGAYLYYGRAVYASVRRMASAELDGLPIDRWILASSEPGMRAHDFGPPAAYTVVPELDLLRLQALGQGPGKP